VQVVDPTGGLRPGGERVRDDDAVAGVEAEGATVEQLVVQ
jgi:hypothetical protein